MASRAQADACQQDIACPSSGAAPARPSIASNNGHLKLRILCLHGFRQTSKQFEGRTHALRKRLKDLAEFVFAQAPHELPLFVKDLSALQERLEHEQCPGSKQHESTCMDQPPPSQPSTPPSAGELNTSGNPVNALTVQSRVSASPGKDGLAARLESSVLQQLPPPAVRKRAWMLSPELQQLALQVTPLSPTTDGLSIPQAVATPPTSPVSSIFAAAGHNTGMSSDPRVDQEATKTTTAQPGQQGGWLPAPSYVTHQQYLMQTMGWDESLAELLCVVSEQGPFDGVLGFSQGCVAATLLCMELQCLHRTAQHAAHGHTIAELPATPPAPSSTGQHSQSTDMQAATNDNIHASCSSGQETFPALPRFVLLASGYPSPCTEHMQLLQDAGPVLLPSMHMFGVGGDDRQVPATASEQLMQWYGAEGRCSMKHAGGHHIPSDKESIARLRQFLMPFLGS